MYTILLKFDIMQCFYMVYNKIVRNEVKNSDTYCELSG